MANRKGLNALSDSIGKITYSLSRRNKYNDKNKQQPIYNHHGMHVSVL